MPTYWNTKTNTQIKKASIDRYLRAAKTTEQRQKVLDTYKLVSQIPKITKKQAKLNKEHSNKLYNTKTGRYILNTKANRDKILKNELEDLARLSSINHQGSGNGIFSVEKPEDVDKLIPYLIGELVNTSKPIIRHDLGEIPPYNKPIVVGLRSLNSDIDSEDADWYFTFDSVDAFIKAFKDAISKMHWDESIKHKQLGEFKADSNYFMNYFSKFKVTTIMNKDIASINRRENRDKIKKMSKHLEAKKARGGCNTNGTNLDKNINGIDSSDLYSISLNVDNSVVSNNNCGYKCLIDILELSPQIKARNIKYILPMKLSKELKLQPNTKRTCEQLRIMYDYICSHHNITKEERPKLYIIEDVNMINYSILSTLNYVHNNDVSKYGTIVFNNEHFSRLIDFKATPNTSQELNKKKNFKKAYYDCETRNDYTTKFIMGTKIVDGVEVENIGYKQRCTIIKVLLTNGKGGKHIISFKSDRKHIIGGKSAARKFVEYIIKSENKYKFIAHNGSNFDIYFILDSMTRSEREAISIFRKGLSLTQVKFRHHVFIDSRDHLAGSLDQLCKDFDIKEGAKKKIVNIGTDEEPKMITSEQLCLYKPELSYEEFLELEETEPNFWKAYEDYCEFDVIALEQIWEKYHLACTLITKELATNRDGSVCKSILKHGQITDKLTIGSAAKKLMELCAKNENIYLYNSILEFIGDTNSLIGELKDIDKQMKSQNVDCIEYLIDKKAKLTAELTKLRADILEKNKFSRETLYGGISHCHRPGIYESNNLNIDEDTNILVDLDICSQYPSAMGGACIIPAGKSAFYSGEELDKKQEFKTKGIFKYYGYYHLKNVQFSEICNKLKIIPNKDEESGCLRWSTDNFMSECKIDSQTLIYYITKGYISSFEIDRALLSTNYVIASAVFGKYVDVLFSKKAEQDVYKNSEDSELNKKYNKALRSSIKMLLNAGYGKCIEDTSKYRDYNAEQSEFEKEVYYVARDINKEKEWITYINSNPTMTEHREAFNIKYDNKNPIKYNTKQSESYKEVDIGGIKHYSNGEGDNINNLIVFGLSILSFSKILLNEYLECMPNKQDDMIHCETDGFVMKHKHLSEFTKNIVEWKFKGVKATKTSYGYPKSGLPDEYKKCFEGLPIALADELGAKLGNLTIKDTTVPGTTSVFLMKKGYCYTGVKEGFVAKMRGICKYNTLSDGTKEQILTQELFENVYNNGYNPKDGNGVEVSFHTFKKDYTKGNYDVISYQMSRTIVMRRS